ncbi:hypothetical protein TWF481_006278 [Arthrobotrys musiformis]|uniref:CFEM domain-containing protein n=1 Tax=Arthrobotrys musiformis TaxID=47236 RepID=A0AAV9WH75_9PEZI
MRISPRPSFTFFFAVSIIGRTLGQLADQVAEKVPECGVTCFTSSLESTTCSSDICICRSKNFFDAFDACIVRDCVTQNEEDDSRLGAYAICREIVFPGVPESTTTITITDSATVPPGTATERVIITTRVVSTARISVDAAPVPPTTVQPGAPTRSSTTTSEGSNGTFEANQIAGGNSRLNTGAIVGIVVGVVVLLALLAFFLYRKFNSMGRADGAGLPMMSDTAGQEWGGIAPNTEAEGGSGTQFGSSGDKKEARRVTRWMDTITSYRFVKVEAR